MIPFRFVAYPALVVNPPAIDTLFVKALAPALMVDTVSVAFGEVISDVTLRVLPVRVDKLRLTVFRVAKFDERKVK